MSTASKPTFVQQVGGTAKNLKRPNCLNFKTKSNLKRLEIIEILKHIEYPTDKLVGVAEMKSRSIDITCRTRENVLELYLKLKRIDYVYNLSLYETENVQVLIGWVSIPLPNERTKNHIQTNFGKIVTITQKHHKDGLISGIRIVTMNKRELEQKPSPSYIMVDAFELYVTYSGQNATCTYCSEIGHAHSACEKRKTDFPSLRKEQAHFHQHCTTHLLKQISQCVHLIMSNHNNQLIAAFLSKMTSSVAAIRKNEKFALNQTQT